MISSGPMSAKNLRHPYHLTALLRRGGRQLLTLGDLAHALAVQWKRLCMAYSPPREELEGGFLSDLSYSENSCFEGEFNMNMRGSSASGGGHFRDSCMPAFSRLCGHPSATSCFFFRTFLCGAILCGNVTSEHKATQIAARTL